MGSGRLARGGMHRIRRALVMLGTLGCVMAAWTSPAMSTLPSWDVVSSPNVGAGPNYLLSVDGVAPDDMWAVGYWEDDAGFRHHLIEHWDGRRWSVVPDPAPPADYSYLESIAAISADDVWAVGYYDHPKCFGCYLILHWDGTKWAAPKPEQLVTGYYHVLSSVAAISADDVWAVGDYDEISEPVRALAVHWNGTRWARNDPYSPGAVATSLYGVAGSASNNVWAVGTYTHGYPDLPLIKHWDGASWEEVPVPAEKDGFSLSDVTSIASDDAWAVGFYGPSVVRWDGVEWAIVQTPAPTSSRPVGVDSLVSGPAWAVGSRWDGVAAIRTMTLRWDGAEWRLTRSPYPGTRSELYEVAMLQDEVWAVGSVWNASDTPRTLTIRLSSP
jgi:hypothetical protein